MNRVFSPLTPPPHHPDHRAQDDSHYEQDLALEQTGQCVPDGRWENPVY